jgi:hypothetical protein
MATIRQQKVPSSVIPIFKQSGIKIKTFKSISEFERVLTKFLKRNNVLHLSTTRNDLPRATPLEYRLDGFTFYVLSEGGAKFNNLKVNKNVSFSIAEPYLPDKDFWGAKGLQAWGKARVYSKKSNPRLFELALHKMKVYDALKKMGVSELPSQFNFRIIEITPDRMTYGSVREGVFKVTWQRKG